MYSLYHSLLAQHPRQLTSVRCAEHTISQLHRYLEEVVLENKLSALVVESLPVVAKRSVPAQARLRQLGSVAQSSFFLVGKNDPLISLEEPSRGRQFVFLTLGPDSRPNGRFV